MIKPISGGHLKLKVFDSRLKDFWYVYIGGYYSRIIKKWIENEWVSGETVYLFCEGEVSKNGDNNSSGVEVPSSENANMGSRLEYEPLVIVAHT